MDIAQLVASVKAIPTYVHREIFKVFSGLGDGFFYTADEIALIFDISPLAVVSKYEEARDTFCREASSRVSFRGEVRSDFTTGEFISHFNAYAEQHRPKNDVSLCNLRNERWDELLEDFGEAYGSPLYRIGWVRPHGGDLIAVAQDGQVNITSDIFMLIEREVERIRARKIGRLVAVHIRPRGDLCDLINVAAVFQSAGLDQDQSIDYLITAATSNDRLIDYLASRHLSVGTANFIPVGT